MSKKPSSPDQAAGGINDVFRIRDILFGEQMEAYSERFDTQDERMVALQAHIDAVAARLEERQNQAASETNRQIAELRDTLIARLDALDHKATARGAFGDMLIDLGERLKSDAG